MTRPEGQDEKMVIELGSISLEPLYGDPNRMWSMPRPEGVRMIDLGQQPTSGPRTGIAPSGRGPRVLGAGYRGNQR